MPFFFFFALFLTTEKQPSEMLTMVISLVGIIDGSRDRIKDNNYFFHFNICFCTSDKNTSDIDIYCMPGTVLRALHESTHLILATILEGRYHYYRPPKLRYKEVK